jgi:hypothetical protein
MQVFTCSNHTETEFDIERFKDAESEYQYHFS